jgi:phospholipid transport system substrate-binding protein
MARIRKHFLFIPLLAFCMAPRLAFGDTPSEYIQETIRQVLSAMNGSVSGGEAARKQLIREIIMPRFDWPEMAKQTLGKHWDAVSARQQEFIAVFVDFLGSTYVGKIGSYKDEKILFVRETIKDNRAQVNTQIVPNTGDPMAVNYQLHRVGGEWKIYDVVVEDISLVGNYRSQFGRILAKGSFDDLLRTLSERQLSQRN